MFIFNKKNKVLLLTTSTLNNYAMENNLNCVFKTAQPVSNCTININDNTNFINPNLVTNAFYNCIDIKHNNTKYMAINDYVCVTYDFKKKIVTKATKDGNCLFNMLSSLIFNTEKYNQVIRLFVCDKLCKDKDMKELGEGYLKKYISEMKQNGTFGEYTIVNIFSKIFNIPIQIVDTLSKKNYDINYHESCANYLRLFYNGTNHYNYGISTLTDAQLKPIVVALSNFYRYIYTRKYIESLNEKNTSNKNAVKNNKQCENDKDSVKNDKKDGKKDNIKEDKKEDKKDNVKDGKKDNIKEDKKNNKKDNKTKCDLFKDKVLHNNFIFSQSTLSLFMLGVFLYDIYLRYNKK